MTTVNWIYYRVIAHVHDDPLLPVYSLWSGLLLPGRVMCSHR